MDLQKLSLDELKKLKKDVEKAISSFETRRRAEARKAMEKVAKDFGLSVEDVIGKSASKPAKAKGNAKYRNPDDPKQTWTGKGRQPGWFKSAIAAGTTPEAMEV